jgi:hypothetical protein
MTQTPLPQTQLEPTGITLEQDDAYTLQRLELCNGFFSNIILLQIIFRRKFFVLKFSY